MSCGSIDFTPAMPGPARRRGGDNAGGGGRRWGQGGSGALGPAKAGPAVVEIGSVPCRDRSGSASRSVRFDGGAPGGRGREAGISARVRRRRRRTRAEMSTSTGARPCAGGSRSPMSAGPLAPHGPDRHRGVVPDAARSYPKAPLQYDPAPQRTTTRIHVRPHEPGYDRPEATAAGPVGRTTARATAPPHDPPTAPDPTRPITPTPRPRPPTPTASRTARPSDNHHPPPAPPRTTPPHNHDNEPISSRN